MNGDQIGAAAIAVAAIVFLWWYKGPWLAEQAPRWRLPLLIAGTAAITASLLYYLGWIG
ncbi:hypothetical protein [Neisseria shayeganii]|uniref:Uncharacterized protein n=1 Tax=Neisseria shayeganii TaxID=607712 RepID=A0A7D7RVA6_9NEIS|nr:hypothetical protein [Neisseria shayeganii]QMT40684.1 hypothetical protein H3L94_01045 [Neisseria shayeganii]